MNTPEMQTLKLVKEERLMSGREMEALKLEIGDRAYRHVIINNNPAYQGEGIVGLVSFWQSKLDLAYLQRKKHENPEFFAQVMGQIQLNRRVAAFQASQKR